MMGAPAPYGGVPYQDPPLAKPVAAFVLSLIGGIIIVLWGAFILLIGATFSDFGVFASGVLFIGFIELITGLLVLALGIGLYVAPQHHLAFGIVILISSIASLIGGGGLFLGFILGLIGGILGIIHHPEPAVYMGPPPGYYAPMAPSQPYYGQPAAPPGYPGFQAQPSPPAQPRYCPSCGAPNAVGTAFCGNCGKPLPPPP